MRGVAGSSIWARRRAMSESSGIACEKTSDGEKCTGDNRGERWNCDDLDGGIGKDDRTQLQTANVGRGAASNGADRVGQRPIVLVVDGKEHRRAGAALQCAHRPGLRGVKENGLDETMCRRNGKRIKWDVQTGNCLALLH